MSSWTAPKTWSVDEIVTAAQLNAQLRDNMRYLKGLDGAVTIESAVAFDDDSNLRIYLDGSDNPVFRFDSTDYLLFNRTSNFLKFLIGGTQKFYVHSDYLQRTSGQYIPTTGVSNTVIDYGKQSVFHGDWPGSPHTVDFTVTFNVTFGSAPTFVYSLCIGSNALKFRDNWLTSVSTTQAVGKFEGEGNTGQGVTFWVHWLAIGTP